MRKTFELYATSGCRAARFFFKCMQGASQKHSKSMQQAQWKRRSTGNLGAEHAEAKTKPKPTMEAAVHAGSRADLIPLLYSLQKPGIAQSETAGKKKKRQKKKKTKNS